MTPYEIHISFPPEEIEKVRNNCCGAFKIHTFQNYTSLYTITDTMTSEKTMCSNLSAAMKKMYERITDMKLDGITILRSKIETIPWHDQPLDDAYFETHINYIGEPLPSHAVRSNCLLSKDNLKKKNILTLRTDFDFDDHMDQLHRTVAWLGSKNIYVMGKPDIEMVIYDSNRAHDKIWEGKK